MQRSSSEPPARARAFLRAACVMTAACASPLFGQTAASDVSADTLARYDANHDGVLDAAELAALRAEEARAATAVATTPASAAEGHAGDVVQMSPFEVNAAGDKGYYASNTLSGTRLNSKLEDLGASITVVTKQQMQDFALLDVNDVFLYEAGTEGTGNYTDFTIDRNGTVIDNVQGNPNGANRVRGIAAANIARGSFAVSGRVPVDPSDIDALEISRGPNSNIFGLGNASGTVNLVPARANLQRQTTTVETRVDSLGGTRESIDLNRPLLRNRLAIRGSVVFQEDHFNRKPSVARSKRYNGMLTWKPFPETTIRASAQYYENYARRPNAILPRDAISYWEETGRPVWDAAASTVTLNGVTRSVPYVSSQATEDTALAPGLQSGGSNLYTRPSLFIEPDGTVGLWEVGRQSGVDATGAPNPANQSGNARLVESATPPSQGPLWQTAPSLTDRARYDWMAVNLAAPNWGQDRVRTFSVELEQFFVRTRRQLLGLQLGWLREEANGYDRNFIGQGTSLTVNIDPNKTLPDGRPNPYFLRPYVDAAEPTATRSPDYRDTFRAQLAYQLSLSQEKNWLRWLGDHTVSGYGEYKNRVYATYRFRDVIVDDHAWLPAGSNRANGSAAARGFYRYYLGDATGDDIDSAPPSWRSGQGTYVLNWYNAVTKQWVQEPATIAEAFYHPSGTTPRKRNIIKTAGATIQDHFFRDRVVTTFGLRRDSNFNRDSSDTLVAPDGIHADYGSNRSWPYNWLRRDGRTKTGGVVVKPFRSWSWIERTANQPGLAGWLADGARSLSMYYNRSDSFQPADIAQNLVGDLLPDPSGKGKDYGFAVSLFHDKLTLRYGRYETVQQNSRNGDSGTIAKRASRLDFSSTSGGNDRFNLYRNAREWVIAANPTWTSDQVEVEVARQMGFPVDELARLNSLPISDTSDVTARGQEIEGTLNPNAYFTGKLTVTQTESVDNHLSPAIKRYIDSRMPLWTTIVDPRSNTAWWTTRYGSGTAQDFYLGSVAAPYKLSVANEGKTKSQIRRWRANAFGTFRLAALSENRWLKNVAVSGAARWEDKASIGYYTMADDPNAFDPSRPIYDEPHVYFDAGASYTTKLYRDRVRMRVQLNVRNLTEDGRLQPIGALPNGQPHSYRIVDPRLFILSASFDL